MGTAREGRMGQNREENSGKEGRPKWGVQQGPGAKRSPLVEDVSEYWESYEGDSSDYVRHLQYL